MLPGSHAVRNGTVPQVTKAWNNVGVNRNQLTNLTRIANEAKVKKSFTLGRVLGLFNHGVTEASNKTFVSAQGSIPAPYRSAVVEGGRVQL